MWTDFDAATRSGGRRSRTLVGQSGKVFATLCGTKYAGCDSNNTIANVSLAEAANGSPAQKTADYHVAEKPIAA